MALAFWPPVFFIFLRCLVQPVSVCREPDYIDGGKSFRRVCIPALTCFLAFSALSRSFAAIRDQRAEAPAVLRLKALYATL
jgi:hypothetical protein